MRRAASSESWDDVPSTATRVLLECRADASPSMIAGVIEREGYAVRTCEGPDQRHSCSLVDDGACSLVNGADVVVHLLDRSDGSSSAEVLPALGAERRPVPVVIEDRCHHDSGGDPTAPRHVERVPSPLTTHDLLSAIRRALGRREEQQAIWGDGFC